MFTIIQSHRTELLVEELLVAYKSKNQPIFAEFMVIVPSMVLGDWLDKSIASQAGISTLVTTKFWGQYQWTLMQKVLASHNSWLEEGAWLEGNLTLENQQAAQEILEVPEVAVLTGAVMQWRLFGYFTYYQTQIMSDEKHPLHPFLSALLDDQADRSQQDSRLWSLATDFSRVFGRYLNHRDNWLTKWSNNEQVDVEQLIKDKDELTKSFDQYAGLTPEWLTEHFVELEQAQRHLWRLLFAAVYEHRDKIETRFWQIMQSAKTNDNTSKNDSSESNSKSKTSKKSGFKTGVELNSILPKQLHIFTIQQLPQNELNFLQKLSTYIDITLLHYNPSQLFWADIVDKQWLQRQQVINPKSVFLREYGHTLLSRLGKQSRETFAMLASLDSNDNKDNFKLIWQDKFDFESESSIFESKPSQPMSLLAHLQQDVLMLDESATQQTTAGRLSAALNKQLTLDLETQEDDKNSLSNENTLNRNIAQSQSDWFSDETLNNKQFEQARQWQLSQYDNSLSIHSCHSLQRQLEVLRGMIGRWLNDSDPHKTADSTNDSGTRHLSDIVVLLPDVERHHDSINSVFVNGKGQDGLTLPAKVTGVVDKSIRQLWEAISGFYNLLGSDTARFESATVLDWLMLPPLYESLGLTHEQMSRACDLLEQAGFVRGFDEAHLQQTLEVEDYDYRFSFAHALDQIALGLIMPEAGISDCLYPDNWQSDTLIEKTVPIAAIGLEDALIIEALCRVHSGLHQCRAQYKARHNAEDWLNRIENQIIHPFFGALDQTRPMRAIFNAMNGFKSSLRANRHYQHYQQSDQQIDTHESTHLNDGTTEGSNDQQNDTNTKFQDQSQVNSRQVEAKLSQVSTLPLKLSFMLDSIEDELESQQVSAEPTGVITFGRFGALRNVPFGLVVMLNMDLAEFPNRDRDNRYDLMKAGLAQRGDRFSEDDDNGAFLDAILCARNACWIFYNGQRLTDIHEHLPANPVSELLQFLQGEVQWQWDPLLIETLKSSKQDPESDDELALAAQVQRYMPKLIDQWLVTQHPALPFAEEVFLHTEPSDSASTSKDNGLENSDNTSTNESESESEKLLVSLQQAMRREKLYQKSTNAPAKVWQQVFERLQVQEDFVEAVELDHEPVDRTVQTLRITSDKNERRPIKVKLPTKADYETIAQRIVIDHPIFSTSTQLPTVCLNNPKLNSATFAISQVDMQQLYYQIRHPAKHFLREQQVHIVQSVEDTVHQEPLSLSSLGAYAVNEHLLNELYSTKHGSKDSARDQTNKAIKALLYNPVMPAGVARQSTLRYQQLKLTQQCQDFAQQLAELGIDVVNSVASFDSVDEGDKIKSNSALTLLTPCAETMISVKATDINAQGQLQIKGLAPLSGLSTAPSLWLNILPNSARIQHLLRFWLAHLYWQVFRGTTEDQVATNDGRSIWRFNKASKERKKYENSTTFELAPISYDLALAELLKWVRFAHIAGKSALALLPVHAMGYLDLMQKAQKDGVEYKPKRSDFDNWMWPGHNSDTVYDTCSQHELWQYILQNQEGFVALRDSLSLAEPLFAMMDESLKPL